MHEGIPMVTPSNAPTGIRMALLVAPLGALRVAILDQRRNAFQWPHRRSPQARAWNLRDLAWWFPRGTPRGNPRASPTRCQPPSMVSDQAAHKHAILSPLRAQSEPWVCRASSSRASKPIRRKPKLCSKTIDESVLSTLVWGTQEIQQPSQTHMITCYIITREHSQWDFDVARINDTGAPHRKGRR